MDVQRYLDAAWEGGTLIICASGNSIKCVGYPARWEKAVSVSALGEQDRYHAQSDSALTVPDATGQGRWNKPLFVPNFVPSRGKVDCIAPGVAVVAVEPPKMRLPFGNWQKSGTSFACPIVTGLLATVLSRDQYYKNLPATAARSLYAKQVLDKICKPLGFDPHLQGRGLPQL
jgi:subtilisin family serine protease